MDPRIYGDIAQQLLRVRDPLHVWPVVTDAVVGLMHAGDAPQTAVGHLWQAVVRLGREAQTPVGATAAAVLGAMAADAVCGNQVPVKLFPEGIFPDEFLELVALGPEPAEAPPLRHVNLGPIVARARYRLASVDSAADYGGLEFLRACVGEHYGGKVQLSGPDLHILEARAMAAILVPVVIAQTDRTLVQKPNPADYLYGRFKAAPEEGSFGGIHLLASFAGPELYDSTRLRVGADIDPVTASAVFLSGQINSRALLVCDALRRGFGDHIARCALQILDENLRSATRVRVHPNNGVLMGRREVKSEGFLISGVVSGLTALFGGARELIEGGSDTGSLVNELRASQDFFARYASRALSQFVTDLRDGSDGAAFRLPAHVVARGSNPVRLTPTFQAPAGDGIARQLLTRCPAQAAAKHSGLRSRDAEGLSDPHALAWLQRSFADLLERALQGTTPGRAPEMWGSIR